MFAFLGKAVARYWLLVLAFWCLLLVLAWYLAPSWERVTTRGEVTFLPPSMPSQQSDQLFQRAFPAEYWGSSIAVVLWRDEAKLTSQDKQIITGVLAPKLEVLFTTEVDHPSILTRIRTLADRGSGALLVSPDRKASLILMELRTPFIDPKNPPIVAKIEQALTSVRAEENVPEGLQMALTGSATAGRDLEREARLSARTIEVWTIAVVGVLLLLLYRAPLVALIPLITVFFAVEISLQSLALLAGTDWVTLDQDVRIFITILAYGAGVDYCLFLIARYREECDRGVSPAEAVRGAIAHVGGAMSASAATVIGGIGMLAFARFGKIHQAGLTIPFALIVVLCAVLTFTPALLCLAGRWAFWPHPNGRAVHAGDISDFLRRLPSRSFVSSLWERLGPVLLRRPGTIWLASVAACLPFVFLALWHYHDQEFNPVSELPSKMPSVAGTQVLERHFPAGSLGPVTVLLENDAIDFTQQKGIDLVTRWTRTLEEQKDDLSLWDIRNVAEPVGITPDGRNAFAGLHIPASLLKAAVRKRAVCYYVSRIGEWKEHVTRMDLCLDVEPLSRQALNNLVRIEDALRADLPAELAGSRLHVCGPTASAGDLATAKQADLHRVQILVPAVVFVLLLVMLRRIVISLYLVASVLFSYLATLGATCLLFWLLDPAAFGGLDWKVPIFLFTILVAVGEDHNIFLITRIREEQRHHGSMKGITLALARTGRVISSCGFIMAGTFATLLSGSLVAMKQLGFALALGILLDTLVVRPILVPTMLILLQSGRLGRVGQRLALMQGERPVEVLVEVRRGERNEVPLSAGPVR
jgi:RND superfamily putative drug exporter